MSNSPIKPLLQCQQPKALSILFLAEMWERFGFYITQGLLVLYLTQAMGLSDNQSYAISGVFTAFVYLSPLLGGYIADRIIGFRIAIIVGGILLAIGYGGVAFLPRHPLLFLYLALATIIVGNGFFKPNVGSLLGTFYQANDSRREAGFTWFYMGINMGSMLATLSSGFVKEAFGWPASFLMASIGLFLGISNFLIGFKYLKGHGFAPPQCQRSPRIWAFLHTRTMVLIGAILAIPVLACIMQYGQLANILLSVVAILLVVGLAIFSAKHDTQKARQQMFALLMLILISVVFWAIFFQIFFSLNLFVERNVNRHFLGHELPTVLFITFESLFIVLLAPLFAKFWVYLTKRNKNPSIPTKFFLSFVFMGIAFLVLSLSTHFHGSTGLVNPLWIPLGYCIITISELLLSPIGLSAVTLLSSKQSVGMMMGVFMIGIGYGGKLAGFIATFSTVPGGVKDKVLENQYYGSAFFEYAMMSFVAAIVVLTFLPWLKRLMMDEKIAI